ncbi:MAG: HEAT repeat domain-containing protein [Gemmatimonadales bacterium]
MTRAFCVLPIVLVLPMTLTAQALGQRVASLGDGTIRLSFAARPGVCSTGNGSISIDRGDDEWEEDCERGLVRVSLRVKDGAVVETNTHLGGRWRNRGEPATDLGTLTAASAAADLLALAERGPEADEELIQAAALADSVVIWPRLVAIARNTKVPMDTRRHAIFWVGQAAEQAATRSLDSIAADDQGDLEIRKQAVFALSQRPVDESVPMLIHIARSSRYTQVRTSAIFWLGQSEDPRALALFEELLR